MSKNPPPDAPACDAHYAGKGCRCSARSALECSCPDADWTDPEVYKLREEVAKLRAEVEMLRPDKARLDWLESDGKFNTDRMNLVLREHILYKSVKARRKTWRELFDRAIRYEKRRKRERETRGGIADNKSED